MTSDNDYVYDEESGEWMPASELASRNAAAGQVEVRDSVGNILHDGDQVVPVSYTHLNHHCRAMIAPFAGWINPIISASISGTMIAASPASDSAVS